MIPSITVTGPVEAQLLVKNPKAGSRTLFSALLIRLCAGTAMVQLVGDYIPQWGDTVRLRVEDGEFVTELEGGVALVGVTSSQRCTLLVRCWQHIVTAQRRKLPRMHCSLPISVASKNDGTAPDKGWVPAICTELGAGGLRFTSAAAFAVGEVIAVSLPSQQESAADQPAARDCITARVTRRRRASDSDLWELAIRFEMISTRQGQLLSDLFAA